MPYCPKSAPAFNSVPMSQEHAIAWCRRVYRAGSAQCDGCKLGRSFGIVEDEKQRTEKVKPVQVRLF